MTVPRRATFSTAVTVVLTLVSSGALAQLTTRVVASGLTRPVQFVQDPVRAGVQYIVQQDGIVRVLVNGALEPLPFLSLVGQVSSTGEQGLLGLAFAPDYGTSRRFYVNFTNVNGHTVIARFQHRSDDPLVADTSTRFDLRWPGGQRYIAQPYSNHNGGKILFGSDGYLYVGMGDGGSGNDPQHHAQNPNSLLGKMLRIDVSVADNDLEGYRIPASNPFANGNGPVAALGEIWAFGLRNPWRFTQDLPALGGTGALIIGDVGQGAREEIDYEPPETGGRNYGWRNVEGTRANVGSLPVAYQPLQSPLFEYDRSEGQSVTGGVVYRGTALGPSHRGRYFFADFASGRVWSLGLAIGAGGDATVTDRVEHTDELGASTSLGNPASIDVDGNGEMYLADWSGGRILRVESLEPDTDGDGLPDGWELDLGLDPASAAGADGATGDPDADGRTNAQEYAAGTHPRGFRSYYFAEGAASTFFALTLAVANPNGQDAHVLIAFNRVDGRRITERLVVPATRHARFESGSQAQLAGTSFGITIESDVEVAVDRTMRWDASRGVEYGAHAETAARALDDSWYFAEGATHSGFSLFYLLTNPNPVDADITVTYLLPDGEPSIVRTYRVSAASRYTVWVNQEDARLAATDVAAVISTSASTPIVAERAMYRDGGGRFFDAGHAALGVGAPALRWLLAEGATGEFFDTFVLVANPGSSDATIRVRWLLPDGDVVVQTYGVTARSRLTLWADAVDPRLADTGVSVIVESQNAVPVVVERSMWWPGPTVATWAEAHVSAGVTAPAASWATAGGESGGTRGASTWVLIANTGGAPVLADVTVLFENRAAVTRTVTLASTSRSGFDVLSLFPEVAGQRYGVLVEGQDPSAELIVERATYWTAAGGFWTAGVGAVASPLQ